MNGYYHDHTPDWYYDPPEDEWDEGEPDYDLAYETLLDTYGDY